MNYDSWKAHNPADMELTSARQSEEEEPPVEECLICQKCGKTRHQGLYKGWCAPCVRELL
jgi:hypothetical protein